MFNRRGQPTTRSEKNLHSSDLAIQSNEWNIPPLDLAIQSNEWNIPPSDLGIQSNKWNIPLPPDLMYHIIDTYLATTTILALCVAFPVLQPYCHPQPYQHIHVYIRDGWLSSQKLFIEIGLSKCPPTLEKDNDILLSTRHDLGYVGTEKERGILCLVNDLTHNLTSIHLSITVKWNELDEYVKVYILALLQRSGLCSVKLEYCNIPVNLLSMVQNLKTLDVDMSLGRPDNVSLSGKRGKVYVEEVRLRGGFQYCLIGPGTPFNWSRLRVIEYYGYDNRPQGLFELCSSSLQVLELTLYEDGKQLLTPNSP